MKKLFFLGLMIATFVAFALGQQSDDRNKNPPKLSADELVTKHLAAIGTSEDRSTVKSRVMVGIGTFSAKVSPGKIGGPAQFASDGQKVLLAMVFNANDYPREKVGFDGKDLTTAILPGGGQSQLDGFLKSSKFILKLGLFGGVLNSSWVLLSPAKGVRTEFGGTSKIDGRSLYKVKFTGPGVGDMNITLFFETDTFRHVRTEYVYRTGQVTSPNPDRPQNLGASASPSTYMMTEEFSDFAKVEGLTLPLTYTIEYESNGGKAVLWTLNFKQVFNNEALDAGVFKVS